MSTSLEMQKVPLISSPFGHRLDEEYYGEGFPAPFSAVENPVVYVAALTRKYNIERQPFAYAAAVFALLSSGEQLTDPLKVFMETYPLARMGLLHEQVIQELGNRAYIERFAGPSDGFLKPPHVRYKAAVYSSLAGNRGHGTFAVRADIDTNLPKEAMSLLRPLSGTPLETYQKVIDALGLDITASAVDHGMGWWALQPREGQEEEAALILQMNRVAMLGRNFSASEVRPRLMKTTRARR